MAEAVSPELAIRLALPGDEADVRQCVARAYAVYTERMSSPPAPALDDYVELIARNVVHVAHLGVQLVGLIVMWPEPDHLYIDNIAVDPNVQGEGVGGALLAYSCEEARRNQRDEIRLYTNLAMVENLGYYQRHGFVETHRGRDAGYERVYFSRSLA